MAVATTTPVTFALSGTTTTTQSFASTTGPLYLLVSYYGSGGSLYPASGTVTFNTVGLTCVAHSGPGNGGDYAEIWRLAAPAGTTANLVITFGAGGGAGACIAFNTTGQNTSTLEGTPVQVASSTNGTGTGSQAIAGAAAGDLTVAVLANGSGVAVTPAATGGSGLAELYDAATSGEETEAFKVADAATAVSASWGSTSTGWALCAITLKTAAVDDTAALSIPLPTCAASGDRTLPSWPYLQAIGTPASGTGDISPAWPTHQAGDVALLFIESTGGQAAALGTASGFAAVANSPQSTGVTTSGTRLTVYWCRATGSSMAAPVVTDPGNHAYGVILTFRGCIDTGDPWEITGGGVKTPATTSVSVTGVTTTLDNQLIVQACTRDNDAAGAAFSAQSNASLSALSEMFDDGTTDGNGGGIGIWSGGLPAHGASGTTSATVTSSINAFLTISLKPGAITGTSVLSVAVPTLAAAGTVSIPNFGALSIPLPTLAGAGDVVAPSFEGTAALSIPLPTLAANDITVATVLSTAALGSVPGATGGPGQNHLVYARNTGRWWFFTWVGTTVTSGVVVANTIEAYVSSGADPSLSTWALATSGTSPYINTSSVIVDTRGSAGDPGGYGITPADGRNLVVGYADVGGVDVVQLMVQTLGGDLAPTHTNDHWMHRTCRARLGVGTASTISWDTVGPNSGFTDGIPDDECAPAAPAAFAMALSSTGRWHALQTQNFINICGMTSAVDPGTGNPAPAWAGNRTYGTNMDTTGAPWNAALAPLASGFMLGVYDIATDSTGIHSGALHYCESARDAPTGSPATSWPITNTGAAIPGLGTSTNSPNDVAVVGRSTTDVHVVRRNSGTVLEHVRYSGHGGSWGSKVTLPATGLTGHQAGTGIALATDTNYVWCIVVDSDANHSIRYIRWDPVLGWASSWSTLQTNTNAKSFLVANQTVVSGRIGIAWTEGTGPYSVLAAVVPAVVDTDITGTAAISLAMPAVAASGDVVNPSFEGTVAITLDLPTLAASGTAAVPEFTGTSAISLALPTVVAEGEVVNPSFEGTAEITLALPTLSAAGTVTAWEITGALSIALPTLAAEGDTTPPEFSGEAVLAVPLPTLEASGDRTIPAGEGAADLSIALPTLAASGTFGPSGTAALSVALPTLSAGGTVSVPTSTGTGALSISPPTLAASGDITVPDFTGSITVILGRPSFTAAGDAVPPAFSGEATLSVPLPGLSAAGDRTLPYAAAELRIALPTIVASGTVVPPPLEATAAIILNPPTLVASGLFIPTIEGTGHLLLVLQVPQVHALGAIDNSAVGRDLEWLLRQPEEKWRVRMPDSKWLIGSARE